MKITRILWLNCVKEVNCIIRSKLKGGRIFYNEISYTEMTFRLSEEEIRRYGLQLAKGLKYLHDNKILHRDLKLSNLLLSDRDIVVRETWWTFSETFE